MIDIEIKNKTVHITGDGKSVYFERYGDGGNSFEYTWEEIYEWMKEAKP